MKKNVNGVDILIPCEPKHLSEVRNIVKMMCKEQNIEEHQSNLLTLAVDEAVSNIILHAKETKRKGSVRLSVDIDDVRFKALIEDKTNNVDIPNSISETELKTLLEREKRYQLSIFLIQSIMDEITYTYRKGFQNELQLIKFLK